MAVFIQVRITQVSIYISRLKQQTRFAIIICTEQLNACLKGPRSDITIIRSRYSLTDSVPCYITSSDCLEKRIMPRYIQWHVSSNKHVLNLS